MADQTVKKTPCVKRCDSSGASGKKIPETLKLLLSQGKEQGYLLEDDLQEFILSQQFSSQQSDELINLIKENGISLVENEEEEVSSLSGEICEPFVEGEESSEQASEEVEKVGSSGDDSIRLYVKNLRHKGLLTRLQEVEIAKRIETGYQILFEGLAQSPITAQVLDKWHAAFKKSELSLQHFIPFETVFPAPSSEEQTDEEEDHQKASLVESTHKKAEKVSGFFQSYVDLYGQLTACRQQRLEGEAKEVSKEESTLIKTLGETFSHVKLNLARLAELIESHHNLYRPLMSLERTLAYQAERAGIQKEDFLQFLPSLRVQKSGCSIIVRQDTAPWQKFLQREEQNLTAYVKAVETLGEQLTIPLTDFRLIINQIQRGEREVSKAKKEMIEGNLRLVLAIAKRYTNHSVHFLDLVQEGNIGLMKAVDKFDYRKGYQFSTYACWWIRQEISRGLVEQSRMIRVPVHAVESFRMVSKVARDLRIEKGREVTEEEIAQKMKASVEKVKKLLDIVKEPVSLDTPIGDEEGEGHLGDFIEDKTTVLPSEAAMNSSMKEALHKVLSGLKPRQERILRLRFGIGLDTDYKLGEIGQEYGVTRERIRQIERKTLSQLSKTKRVRELRAFLQG